MQLAAATAAKGTYRPMRAGKCWGGKQGARHAESLGAELAVPESATVPLQDLGVSQPH